MRVAGSLAEICNERLIIATLTNRRETFVCLGLFVIFGGCLGKQRRNFGGVRQKRFN